MMQRLMMMILIVRDLVMKIKICFVLQKLIEYCIL